MDGKLGEEGTYKSAAKILDLLPDKYILNLCMVLLSSSYKIKFMKFFQTCTAPISTLICLGFMIVHSCVYKTNSTDLDIKL